MDYRGVFVSALAITGSVLAFGSASCSSVDPSTVNFEEKPKQQEIVADGGGSSSGSSGGEGGAGEGGAVDGGGEAGGPVNAFTGAAAYDATSAGATTGSNQPAGHAAFAAKNPAGQACYDCHKNGGAGPEFSIGGTIYTAVAGTTALTTHAEVRIVDPAGKLVVGAYSDELGNVWTDPVPGGIPVGSSIGVRNGTTIKLMSTKTAAATDGNCNQSACHASGGAAGGRVFLQ